MPLNKGTNNVYPKLQPLQCPCGQLSKLGTWQVTYPYDWLQGCCNPHLVFFLSISLKWIPWIYLLPDWVPTGLGPASFPMGPTSLCLLPPITPHFTYLFWWLPLWRRSGQSTAQPSYSYIKLYGIALKVPFGSSHNYKIVLDRLFLSAWSSNLLC